MERKETAKSALRNAVWEAFIPSQALKLSDSSEEDKKAQAGAQNMVELFAAEVNRMKTEIIALDEASRWRKRLQNPLAEPLNSPWSVVLFKNWNWRFFFNFQFFWIKPQSYFQLDTPLVFFQDRCLNIWMTLHRN